VGRIEGATLGLPTFRYTTLATGGGGRTIEAPDRAAAIRALAARGEAPTRVEEIADGTPARSGGGGGGGFALRRAMSRADLGSFMHELATAVGAGLPVVPALRTIARSGRSEAEKRMLAVVIEDVEHGDSLADALERVGKPFDELVVSLVHAGEVAGRLPEVLDQAALLLDRELKLKRALVGAMIYPAIILSLVTVAIIVVVTVIVPRVLASVAGQIETLPLPTRMVQGVASFFGSWWWLVLLGIAALLWGWNRAYANPATRLPIDRALVSIPVIGRLIRDVAVARFTRTLGTLVGAGLPVLQALRITRKTLGNRELQRHIERVAEEVGSGATIADPLERSGQFPPLLVQIVGMGERTGKLDEMLLQAADAFEQRTEQAIKLFTAVLPPLLIVLLAAVVAVVLLAILLPLLELQESIGV
jgi:type II secretory pathway component PulF